jgi:hypothetical protein
MTTKLESKTEFIVPLVFGFCKGRNSGLEPKSLQGAWSKITIVPSLFIPEDFHHVSCISSLQLGWMHLDEVLK